ncbi:CPBP family intramembrane metalloprotease [Bacillus wiedmannii]|uniref:CPBP family intramembrane metalloprotease n=1 Tax=Bacillus wiedmannii TaxID=1890302 RepID=A0A2B6UFQ5_9BACI|nr:CPBP family intramembrane metalloprotease [Bacillus wiedmannii]PGD64798.1 CPBP family intramembrane metalloprotease [Bacillus wiedmannii]PHG59549.1 CPBP family intramembrane metalloprotease [Bacillus wiedmannii]
MNREKKLTKPVASFIVLTNIIFLPLFLLVGAISMLGFPTWIFDVMFCISSWSSTFAFAVLFKKIYPGQSFLQFVKDKFKDKLKISVLLIVSVIQTFIFLMILFVVSKNSEVDSIFTVSSWGMWHLPIWFTTGFVGIDLIKYIIFFMISIISIKIVMTAFYNLNQNLIIPIIIHQFFNFFIGIINGNLIDLIMYNAIFYLVVVVVLIVVNPKKALYGTK